MAVTEPITFEQFMQQALHDPVHGYYARHITGVGRRGDFTTAAMLSEAPARAIAGWAASALRATGCHDLIEIGPGEGTLAAAVWRALPWRVRWRSRLHLVETSGPLARRQQELLDRQAVWHESPAAALQACGGRAVIFSNELVDAFPVRRFQHTPDGWRELAVAGGPAGPARELLLAPAPLPPSSGFAATHPPGQWIEVHDSYRRWLSAWLPQWRAGRLLTIDYGARAESLYHRRPHGTLRAYLLQQRLEGPAVYQNKGRQDLTADVNFTDLIDWAGPWTGAPHLQPLADFLRRAADPANPADRALTDPHGAGGAFLVLDQPCRD